MTNEEKGLLKKLASCSLDGLVGDERASGESTVWMAIKNGVPTKFRQGPTKKFFNGKENERIEGVLHTMQKWITDDEKLAFLRKFGFLMKDADVKAYSKKFKPQK